MALLAQNAVAAQARKGAHKREKTHCWRGHPLSGDNVYSFGGKQRKCKTCTLMRNTNPPPPTEQQVQRVTDAINEGKKASQFCEINTPERIIGFNKLNVLRRINPEFDQLYRSKVLLVRHRPRVLRPTPPREIVLTQERIEFNQIADLVPRYLPHDVRDDVIQMIFLAIAEGTLERDQAPARVGEFIGARYRDARRHGVGKYGLRSLDAPIYADSTTTLTDKVNRKRMEIDAGKLISGTGIGKP